MSFPSVSEYFDSVAEDYREHYNPKRLMDMSRPYPANYIRLQMLKKSFQDRLNVIDIGCGDGTVMTEMHMQMPEICGFDVSPQMVRQAKRQGFGDRVIQADITQPETYAPLLKYTPFDGLTATGVMPHIEDTEQALRNMQALVKGKVFIEFRNDLFNLFAMNMGTAHFMKNMVSVYNTKVYSELFSRLPQLPETRPYDTILSKYHNPFEVEQLFKRLGFTEIKLLFYHQHPTLPWLERADDIEFRTAALALEMQPPQWQDYFRCSAFVVEAWNE